MMHDSQKSQRLNASRGVDLGSFEVLVVVIVCESTTMERPKRGPFVLRLTPLSNPKSSHYDCGVRIYGGRYWANAK
jgi:hypothetical protein